MHSRFEKRKEKENQDSRNPSKEKTITFADNRPEAIAQRKLIQGVHKSAQIKQLKSLQEVTNGGQSKLPIQFVKDKDLKQRGEILRQMTVHAPYRGINLWMATDRKTGGELYVLGTQHGLKMSEMGTTSRERNWLIQFLQHEHFTHVFTEVAMDLPRLQHNPNLTKILDEKIALQKELEEAKDRKSALRAQAKLGNLQSQEGGWDMTLDNAYLALASVGKETQVGTLETNESRRAAYDQNKTDAEADGVNIDFKTQGVPDTEGHSAHTVKTGNERNTFLEVAMQMLQGKDIASAEERNKQWTTTEDGAPLVKAGEKKLWIVGSAHIPGLTIRFHELGMDMHPIVPY